MGTGRAFLTRVFPEAEEDAVLEEEEEEEGGSVTDSGGKEAEVMLVLLDALLRGAASSFPVDPPPFCDLGLTTFSSSMWVSAVPWARPKSTRAYLQRQDVTSLDFCFHTWVYAKQMTTLKFNPTTKPCLHFLFHFEEVGDLTGVWSTHINTMVTSLLKSKRKIFNNFKKHRFLICRRLSFVSFTVCILLHLSTLSSTCFLLWPQSRWSGT